MNPKIGQKLVYAITLFIISLFLNATNDFGFERSKCTSDLNCPKTTRFTKGHTKLPFAVFVGRLANPLSHEAFSGIPFSNSLITVDKEKVICNVDEKDIAVALDILKFHTRTVPGVIEANHVDVDSFARGVGLVSLIDDKSDGDRKIEDLKLLYRAYVTNALASGHMQDNKYGFTKREKKKSFLKPLKILYVKKMSERQKGMQISLGKPPHW
ncbi:hypothetical protein P8452_43208 [Trifolium repens]|nr:hypothetical protein P8452_43208 [Trifolium repens]